jgi:hypothetical protein
VTQGRGWSFDPASGRDQNPSDENPEVDEQLLTVIREKLAVRL